MDECFDVIIVGSGPAGATAAYDLGEAGKRVLVLEKETLPRKKACGGGLSLDFLKRQFPFSFDPVIETNVSAFCYIFDGRRVTIPVQDGRVVTVMRDRLDAHLLAHARAEICQGMRVQQIVETPERVLVETKDGERFTGRYLIGADGANSIVAHSLRQRPNRTRVAAVEAEVAVAPETLRRYQDRMVFIFGEIQMGYLWIFPKADHLSVGIAALKPGRGELQTTLSRVMESYGIPLGATPLQGHPIPIYTPGQPVATGRILLAGDAAGLADPLSGEGIRFAIKSGRLAAQCILSGHPERYPHIIARKIGVNHTFSRAAAWFFYHFQRPCLRLGAPNPVSTRVIVDLLSDQASTATLMLNTMLTLPLLDRIRDGRE